MLRGLRWVPRRYRTGLVLIPPADELPASPSIPGTQTTFILARHKEASGVQPTAEQTGLQFLIMHKRWPLAPWRWRRRTRRFCTSVRAKLIVAVAASLAPGFTASTTPTQPRLW